MRDPLLAPAPVLIQPILVLLRNEGQVVFIIEPGGDAVADAAEGIGITGCVARVVDAVARQHAGVERILPQDPVELALAEAEQRPGLLRELFGGGKGHGSQGGQPGILTLPPVTGFIVVGDKEADARRFIHPFYILAGEREGVACLGAKRQLGGQRLLHHGLHLGLVPLIRLYA